MCASKFARVVDHERFPFEVLRLEDALTRGIRPNQTDSRKDMIRENGTERSGLCREREHIGEPRETKSLEAGAVPELCGTFSCEFPLRAAPQKRLRHSRPSRCN